MYNDEEARRQNTNHDIPNPNTNIQTIIDKIKTLSIPDNDKILLMNQFKQNIMNPSQGEDKNLDYIQNKYLGTNPNLSQILDMNYLPNKQNTQTQPQFQYPNQQPQFQYPNQQPQFQYPNQQPIIQNNLMTIAHFDILKNKIDTLQYELIDLLRHVKDYTQRYMNSVRQQDLAKIDEYINGILDVDKKLKETTEQASMEQVNPTTIEEPVSQESVITKATNGIKNFMGSLGDNVSGITKLVKSTAGVANSYLSEKIIKTADNTTNPMPTSNTTISNNTSNNTISNNTISNNTSNNIIKPKSIPNNTTPNNPTRINNMNTNNTTANNTTPNNPIRTNNMNTNKNKSNVISIEEYMNMNKAKEVENSNKPNIILNSNNINNLINKKNDNEQEKNDNEQENANNEQEKNDNEQENANNEQENVNNEQENVNNEEENVNNEQENANNEQENANNEEEKNDNEQENASNEEEKNDNEQENVNNEQENVNNDNIKQNSLGHALKVLNKKINEDIYKPLKGNEGTNMSLQQTGGYSKTHKLKSKIQILKLKLTKKKLQKELYKKNSHKNTKNKLKKIKLNKNKLNKNKLKYNNTKKYKKI